jgi:flagellar basal-body rod modification protein FlgD
MSAAAPIASSSLTAGANSTLNQADFLKLLVTQMTSQDPLNPESDTDFAAQLAQFSSLQEATTMAGNMAAIQASSLIGATVSVESATNSNQETTGVVSGVDMSSGSPEIQVNGQLYALSQILSISPTQSAAAATAGATAPAKSSNP